VYAVDDEYCEVKDLTTEELIERYDAMVKSIVRGVFDSLSIHVDMRDALQYGYSGLMDAQQRYDPESEASFASYSYYRIRGSILDGCRKHGWRTRDRGDVGEDSEVEGAAALNDFLQERHEIEAGVPPARTLTDSIDRLCHMVGDSIMVVMLQRQELENLEVPDPAKLPDERVVDSDKARKMMSAIEEHLTEIEHEVVQRYHFDNESMKTISDDMGYSKSWISRVNSRAIEKLRRVLLDDHEDDDRGK
jgi:RNA polymerase sigma factor for flagellar operon FliA